MILCWRQVHTVGWGRPKGETRTVPFFMKLAGELGRCSSRSTAGGVAKGLRCMASGGLREGELSSIPPTPTGSCLSSTFLAPRLHPPAQAHALHAGKSAAKAC